MFWPEGTPPGAWPPVAQNISAPSMREAVGQVAKHAGRYKAVFADESGRRGGLVRVDPDGSVHDVEVF